MGKLSGEELPRMIVGYGAAILSCYFLLRYRTEAPVVAASLFFLVISITDTLTTRIPNLLILGLLLAGVTINIAQSGWSGILQSLLGLGLGIGLLVVPYAMGGFGAGDVKALGALGALTGPAALLHIFVYMAFYGGAMAVLHYLFNSNLRLKIRQGWASLKTSVLARDIGQLKPVKAEPLRFPYAAAIAFGYYTYIVRGALLL